MRNWRKALILVFGGYFVVMLITGLAIELVLSGFETEGLLASAEERVRRLKNAFPFRSRWATVIST